MSNADGYRKEQDLIFQQIEELERLESQALLEAQEALHAAHMEDRYKFINRLCRAKAFQDLMRSVSIDDRITIVRTCIQAWEKNNDPSGTRI
jgi:hypothetical protein